jgi:hypothetical protein
MASSCSFRTRRILTRDVRFGSFATEKISADSGQCPLLVNSEHFTDEFACPLVPIATNARQHDRRKKKDRQLRRSLRNPIKDSDADIHRSLHTFRYEDHTT